MMTPNNLSMRENVWTSCIVTVILLSRIPHGFALVWMRFFFPDLRRRRQGDRVLDLGTGTGIIPILMEAKTKASDFFALEIQEESADMARRSVRYNHLEDKIRIITGDMKDASKIFGASSFDIVTTNPPYMIGQHGISSASDAKAIARHEVYVIWTTFCGRAPDCCARTDGFIWCIARSVWQRFLPRWSLIKSSRNG